MKESNLIKLFHIYYHLAQKDLSVLGELDISSTADQHLDGSLGAEVGADNLHEADGTIDVQLQSLATTGDLRVGVNERDGRSSRPNQEAMPVSVKR